MYLAHDPNNVTQWALGSLSRRFRRGPAGGVAEGAALYNYYCLVNLGENVSAR